MTTEPANHAAAVLLAAEGDELGAHLCFCGINIKIYSTLAGYKPYYEENTGTGNNINANHPVIRDHILPPVAKHGTGAPRGAEGNNHIHPPSS